MLLALILAAQSAPSADVRVVGPGRPNGQTPATLVVEPAAMLIVACDADADGRTSRTELQQCLARTLPAEAIGYLAYADWQKSWLGDQGALPGPFEIDRDGDSRITPAEVQAQFGKLFSRYDKDGDAAITRAEALTIRAMPAGGRNGSRRDERIPGERVPGGQPPTRPVPLTPGAGS